MKSGPARLYLNNFPRKRPSLGPPPNATLLDGIQVAQIPRKPVQEASHLGLAADAVPVAVEPVRITSDHGEVPVGDVAAVQVRRRWRDADRWVGRVTA